ncbi:MAG: (deoxy)nucleoside triphosphate pyrophosphohydrolase [Christensenellaceae bacterium]|nr:(deoxy)nucleoside triphosphate pyrophosphohydrolase [Christensenellaceae bacterium]
MTDATSAHDAVDVVAALIWDGKKFLACRRPAHKARGLMWEFVGGKVEKGETREQALIRECREELDVILRVGSVFAEVIHEYPDITVHLVVYNAEIAEGEPKKLEHAELAWVSPEQIDDYEFCPADISILNMIKEMHRED